ncbi:LarC family nickel insertion protein [Aquabacter sp. P-9]|uniref:LarC family nickel insertion protein n=1 Tax=Aquabacter sediminis TaxID=3029197 RepID=UPI00237E4EE7|nr:LarC family nickel insertion protein [Aquabacter sp. P-9]MDE1570444.1 LarC family nickel insertion protein [Aquabacter sp. P-9]
MALHIHLDPVGGIAGDMFVAALLAARPDLKPRVLADVAAVLPPGVGEARIAEVVNGGIAALHFSLAGPGEDPAHGMHHASHSSHSHAQASAGGDGMGESHSRSFSHCHSHAHSHSHAYAHAEAHQHAHPHASPRPHAPAPSGTFADMRARIRDARLNPGTADAAIAILTVLAEAEARMHRMPVEAVHFHEIGDWDSLMDVVAAGSIAAALPGATWSLSPLPLGGGMVKTAHGLLPVPAPATLEILTGFPWRDDGVEGERVTPTGAAILRHLMGDAPAARPALASLKAVGYGAGTRSLPGLPNVLRASLFETSREAARPDLLVDIAFDIDDMTGEEMAHAADLLRATTGVRDLRLVPGLGKKGRPLTTFALLCEEGRVDAISEAVFLQTSTLGLRFHRVERRVLARTHGHAADGRPVKHATRPDGQVTAKVEADALSGLSTLAARRAAGRSEP